MRCGRFAVLSFALILAGLLVASLAGPSVSAVVTCCFEPAQLLLAEAGEATHMPDGHASLAGDGIAKSGGKLCGPAAARLAATPSTISSTGSDALDGHSGRAPPLA